MPIEWTCPSKDAYSCYEHARFITESGEKMAARWFYNTGTAVTAADG